MKSPRRHYFTGSPFEAEMAYSRALVQGDWCFVSGVTGYDYASMQLPGSADEQAEQAFRTIEQVLSDAGFGLQDIVRVQYTVTERGIVPQLAPVLRRWLGDVRPAATMVIAGLIEAEMLIEIEVTAFRG